MSDKPLSEIMVDIETLGNGPNGAIVQIGAVRFEPYSSERGLISSPEGSFKFNVELTGVPEVDGVMETSTVKWWMSQDKNAQRRVFEPVEGFHGTIFTGVFAFASWVESQGPFEHIWANPPDFDLRLLKEAFDRALNLPNRTMWGFPQTALPNWPASRKDVRDFRTLKTIARRLGIEEPVRVGVHHDALDDAHHQAAWALETLRAVAEFGAPRLIHSACGRGPCGTVDGVDTNCPFCLRLRYETS